MLATLLIIFREVIEAGLIVGIVMAATRGVPARGRWIGSRVRHDDDVIGLAQMARLPEFIARRQEIAAEYDAGIDALRDVKVIMLTALSQAEDNARGQRHEKREDQHRGARARHWL